MKRKQLFEFMDQPWMPAFFRNGIREFLYMLYRHFSFHTLWADKIADILRKTNCREIVDLCSGGTGPAPLVLEALRNQHGIHASVTMTDIYPSRRAIDRIASLGDNDLSYLETPVDAGNVPDTLPGVRTIFSAFHHMPPNDAREILRDACSNHRAICVFETTENSWHGIFSAFLSPLEVLRATVFMRPVSVAQLLFTYIVPVFPLLVFWDAFVSNLRTYSEDELRFLLEDLDNDRYHWELGELRLKGIGNGLPYLIGIPVD